MAQVCHERRPGAGCDFAVAPGDLIYDNGVSGVADDRFRKRFEEPFQPLGNLPFWSVPGNHDWHRSGSVQAEIDYTARSERWRMPFFHFAVPGLPAWLHLYGVDTAVIDDLKRAAGADRAALEALRGKQIEAARGALCGKPGWRLLFGHHPVYSSGQHGRDDPPAGVAPMMREALEPLIRDCRVQVYLAGHDHMQEHLRVDSPAYHQVIQGAGSEVRDNEAPFTAAGVKSEFLARKYGFALVTATAQRMKVEFFGFASGGGPAPGERVLLYGVDIGQ
jgi:hypothetical protein